MSSAKNIGAVILAAGSSSRMGEPKQLLEFDGQSLLSHSIIEAANSEVSIVIVVIGANAELTKNEIDDDIVHIVENQNWKEGMASSLRLGLKTLKEIDNKVDGVIFMVCDQPYISSSILDQLIVTQQRTAKGLVTCDYGGSIGPPALFHKKYFRELAKLKGDVGARNIIRQNRHDVATIQFPKGQIDIDTKEDYAALKNL